MRFDSSKLVSWIAIFSLFLSSGLTLTHYHDGQDCGCSETSAHQHAFTAPIAGLDRLPAGDCECTDCDVPIHQLSDTPTDDHEHESCSICRMVYEHGVEATEFSPTESVEPSTDFIAPTVSVSELEFVSRYLTRGPPALTA